MCKTTKCPKLSIFYVLRGFTKRVVKKSCKNKANQKFKRTQINGGFYFHMNVKSKFKIKKKKDIERYSKLN